LKFEKFQIPFYQEAKKLAVEAATRVPQLRVVGWDVAIQADGPILIEGNQLPGLVYSEIAEQGYSNNPVFMELFEEITS
jgi:D-alanine-D-alanine ligase-like ATP-grasp enzyme